nr:MAG: putative RNA-dependent RNA polymerase [Mitoviridae sp.]
MFMITRNLHVSRALNQERFTVNGVEMTREQVLETKPINRSVAHWLILVDWDLFESKPFVVVDPYNPNSLLYSTQADYLSLGKICASNDLTFLVVASPATKRPVPHDPSSSQNSPLPVGFESKWSRASRTSWKTFLDLRKKVRSGLPVVKDSTMVSERPETVAKTVLLWAAQLLHYTEVKNPGRFPVLLQPLIEHLRTLLRNNGQMTTVKYLKVSLFVLYSYISGNPVDSTHPLGLPIRLRSGLPASFGLGLRNMIRSGNLPVIRVMASLLNIYRAMDAKHPEFSVDTITQPCPDLKEVPLFIEFQSFCREVFPTLIEELYGEKPLFQYESALGLLLRTAGPNFSGPSSASTVLDAQAWRNAPHNYVKEWFEMHGDVLMSENLAKQGIEHQWLPDILSETENSVLSIGKILMAVRPSKAFVANGAAILGRLHTIDEPAGKVRVVAICDYWTQAALKPVHEFLFQILRCIPSDATFDQDGRTVSYFQRGLSPHWSFDLKSATDLIPLPLYKEVLRPFLDGTEEGTRTTLWANILTDRDFHLPPTHSGDGDISMPKTVRYLTGQPMGALSSWASMALVHHALVQFAHFRATGKKQWFADYLVLGDDVDIASSEAVSTAYKEICAAFSIIIGLAKSLHSSKNCFEFANRRFSPDGDISPISLREELSSLTWTSRIEFAKRILSRLGKPVESSTLLRRVLTLPQWTIVSPELSGKRSSTMIRLVEYCLHNPFNSLKEVAGTCISSLLKWVTNVIPDEDGLLLESIRVDTLRSGHLGHRLTSSLLEEIRKEILGLLEANLSKILLQDKPQDENIKWKSAFQDTFGQNTPLANDFAGRRNQLRPYPDGLKHVYTKALSDFDKIVDYCRTTDWNPYISAPLSPVAWQYFLLCINMQNMRFLSDLSSLWDRWENISRRHAVEHSTLYYHRIGDSGDRFLAELLELWVDLRSTPGPLLLDLNKSINWNFDYNNSRENLLRDEFRSKGKFYKKPLKPEHVFGPMLELSKIVAEYTGVSIPNLPFFAMARKGKHWHNTLIRSAAYGASLERARMLLSLAEQRAALYEENTRLHSKGFRRVGRG